MVDGKGSKERDTSWCICSVLFEPVINLVHREVKQLELHTTWLTDSKNFVKGYLYDS